MLECNAMRWPICCEPCRMCLPGRMPEMQSCKVMRMGHEARPTLKTVKNDVEHLQARECLVCRCNYVPGMKFIWIICLADSNFKLSQELGKPRLMECGQLKRRVLIGAPIVLKRNLNLDCCPFKAIRQIELFALFPVRESANGSRCLRSQLHLQSEAACVMLLSQMDYRVN